MRAVLRTQLGGIGRRPARLLLTGLAVLVVSYVVYATVLAQEITTRSLLNGLSGTPAAVDLVVGEGAVTGKDLAAIGKLPGVAETAGRTEAGGQLGNEFLQVTGDSGTGPLALSRLSSGRLPTGTGEIAVTTRTAERLALPVGTRAEVAFRFDEQGKPIEPVPLTVVGVVTAAADHGFQAYAPQPAVAAMTGTDDLLQIDVRLAPGADREAVRDRIEALIAASGVKTEDQPRVAYGSDVRLDEARAKAEEVDEVFLVIAMFVAIAVIAAGLVAASTFRIVFAQRMRQLALLRAVGAGRGALRWSLAAEGALTGLVAGTAGVLLALGTGHALPPLVAAFGPRIASPGLPVAAALGTVLLAVFITTVAVLAPAFSAARVSPLEALRGAAVTGSRRDIGGLRWAFGVLLVLAAGTLAGYVLTHLPARDAKDYDPAVNLFAVVASGGVAFLALIALGPVLVGPVLAALGAPIRRSGAVGRLAAGGVGGAPRRAAAVSVVVALGVTLIAGTLVGGASIRMLAERESASSAPADYELTAQDSERLIPASVAEQLRGRPELTNVAPYRRLQVGFPGSGSPLDVNDLAVNAVPRLRSLDVTTGSLGDLGPGRMVISGYAADVTGLKTGDQVTLNREGRSVRLTVAAQLPDSAPLGSAAVLDPSDLTKLGAGSEYAGLLADATGSGERGRADGRTALIQAAAKTGGRWAVEVLADQRDELDTALTILLAIALGLIGLTVLIAVVGVGTTTALSVVERARESGLLRAVGMSRGGLRLMLTTESALYGVIGAAIGLLLGVPYAWLAVRALGVNAPLTLPVGQLALVFAILVLLTAAAGVLPARKAAKVSPVVALGTE
ncbi:ABC transporter permease [Paractinoplanes rishiriensis]|uniref:ABC transporter substrate-binding protein n=1 Tax=Paractinoplanes rishiriensis TaxID=1050105 RepID=A0A919JU02_9ACTN|nr:FtsX-like permease family protein [Actinoplanes rishiriensis]GIE94753.1 ABC transporter substrate-binding protein [Actinoplanes rishiriensis]